MIGGASTATTLCFAWILERRDGLKLGFTDHDQILTINGVTCEPKSGFNASAIEAALGLSADINEVEGALDSEQITAADIANKLYQRAKITQYLVDWNNPDAAKIIRRFHVGEITEEGPAFRVELRSYSTLLDRQNGRFYKRNCDATFGDERCGIDSNSSQWRALGTVAAGPQGTQTISIILAQAVEANWFANGVAQFSIEGLSIQRAKIATSTSGKLSNEIRIGLVEPLRSAPVAGNAVTLTAGCDKAFQTCKSKFNNALQFRGFPHMPGNDKALNYADNVTQFDGKPLVP